MAPLPQQLWDQRASNRSDHVPLFLTLILSVIKYCYFISMTLIFPLLSKATSQGWLSSLPWISAMVYMHIPSILHTKARWPRQHKKKGTGSPRLSGCWQNRMWNPKARHALPTLPVSSPLPTSESLSSHSTGLSLPAPATLLPAPSSAWNAFSHPFTSVTPSSSFKSQLKQKFSGKSFLTQKKVGITNTVKSTPLV